MQTIEETKYTSVLQTLGHEANGFESTLKKADLNWEVKEDEIAGADTGIMFPNRKGLYRSDNNAPLGIVGKDYSPSDPKTFLQTQYDFAEFINGKVTRAGFIPERSRAFGFIKVCDIEIPRNQRKVGDPLSCYIYSIDGWDGGTPQASRLYVERLTCSNGQTSRKLSAKLWNSHTKNREERFEGRWKVFLGEIKEEVAQIREDFTRLAQEKMTAVEFERFLNNLIPGKSTMTQNRRKQILEMFSGGVGNLGETRWDAYNAITEYVTHHRSYRGNDNVPVTTNRFLGVLETDEVAGKAMDLLLN